jgi:hypothetical protein
MVILRSPADIEIREGGGKDLNVAKAPQNDNLIVFGPAQIAGARALDRGWARVDL